MAKRFLVEIEGTEGFFSQNVSASASPTEVFHLTNKEYVDSRDLESLSDVELLELSDKDILVYDDAQGVWKNEQPETTSSVNFESTLLLGGM